MLIVRLGNGSKFEIDSPNSSILDAASKANITLPYSCKTGRCGSCRCRVLSGETHAFHPETGLSVSEKNEGWILSCARTAMTDLSIEVDDLCDIHLPKIKTLPCKISDLKLLASDVMQVKLRLPPTSEFHHIPGQYIDLIGPNGVRRSYSLANASSINQIIELHIRAVNGGVMSQYWFNVAKVGDLLRLNGPFGTFFLRDTSPKTNLIFLATGTGIAPIKAMLESLNDYPADKHPGSVVVVWGGRTPQDLYFDTSTVPVKHTFLPVLSRTNAKWSGASGYVQEALLSLKPNLSDAMIYACGSSVMIQSSKDQLIKCGLPPKQFYSDAFVSSSI